MKVAIVRCRQLGSDVWIVHMKWIAMKVQAGIIVFGHWTSRGENHFQHSGTSKNNKELLAITRYQIDPVGFQLT